MNFRTDLALERREYREKDKLDGVLSECKTVKGIKVTTIEIINSQGEKLLGKPEGKYITLETDKLSKNSQAFSSACRVLCDELRKLLPGQGTVLVAGLGNDSITPDALGPKSLDKILATRHISSELADSLGLGNLRSVAGIVPGVLGKTGIETVEIISGVVKKISPCCVIVIDALAARKTERLGTTVQISSAGVEPGSGVGNRRKSISRETLGVPVIAIGVPTVVDAATMAMDVIGKAGAVLPEEYLSAHSNMVVTPKEIDSLVDNASHLIAMGINTALQTNLTPQDIAEIIG